MPTYYPEGNAPAPFDDTQRLYVKWCQALYDLYGNVAAGTLPYPEGALPLPYDDEERLLNKITALRNANP